MDTSTRTDRQVFTSIDWQIKAHIRADRHGHVYKDRQERLTYIRKIEDFLQNIAKI
jgi:hypothetical protein